MAFMHGAAINAGPTNMSIWQLRSVVLLASTFRLGSAMSITCVTVMLLLTSELHLGLAERQRFMLCCWDVKLAPCNAQNLLNF